MIIINPLPINPHIFLTFTCLRYIYKWKLLVCYVRKKMYLYFFCQPRTPPPPWNITVAQLSTLQFRMPSLSLVPLFPTNTHHTAQPTHKKYIHTSCSQFCFPTLSSSFSPVSPPHCHHHHRHARLCVYPSYCYEFIMHTIISYLKKIFMLPNQTKPSLLYFCTHLHTLY